MRVFNFDNVSGRANAGFSDSKRSGGPTMDCSELARDGLLALARIFVTASSSALQIHSVASSELIVFIFLGESENPALCGRFRDWFWLRAKPHLHNPKQHLRFVLNHFHVFALFLDLVIKHLGCR
jgi:hypothetical protein